MLPNQFLPTHLRQDAPRPENRVRLNVYFSPDGAKHCVVGGKFVSRPKDITQPVEIVVYESDVASVEAAVEKNHEALAIAKQSFMRKLRNDAARRLAIVPDQLAEDERDWPEEARKERERTGYSVEAEMHQSVGCTPKPLLRIERIETLPPPQTEQELQTARLAMAIGAAPANDNAKVVALTAQVQALTAQVEALLAAKKKS